VSNIINADNGVVSTVPGLKYSADTSGELILQTNTTNALTLDTTQGATFATGALVTNPYAGSYSGGMVLDHTTSLGRISVAASSAIAFYNGGISARVETMRISSTGLVGIGTATPDSKLTISKNSAAPAAITGTPYLNIVGANSESPKLNFDAYANLNTIIFRRANGTQASPSALVSGDQMGNFAVFGYGATSYTTTNRGYILFAADENWTDSAQGSRIAFATTTNGTASAATERMRIDSSGNVGIGTSSPSSKLHVAGGSGSTIRNTASAGSSWFVGSNVDSYILHNESNTSMILTTNGTERMRITSTGSVGIGTTSTVNTLDVRGNGAYFYDNSTTDFQLTIASSLTTIGTTTATPLRFKTGDTERMRLDTSGNLLFNSGYGSVATAYGCRAWVNFDGTGTPAIRASGNVSSITDNGTGDYTINFSTAMPDANYAASGILSWQNGVSASGAVAIRTDAGTPTASAFRINCVGQNGTAYDRDYVLVSVFR
jgi:hypothetical protein